MGVKGLASYIRTNLPNLIKKHPQRWHSPELKGKKVALDGSLVVNRLYFAGHADEDKDSKRVVIGWHDLITRMRRAGVIPIAVWDEPGPREWKAPEHARRASQRSLHLSRSLHEEERSQRMEALVRWVEKAKGSSVEEQSALGQILAVTGECAIAQPGGALSEGEAEDDLSTQNPSTAEADSILGASPPATIALAKELHSMKQAALSSQRPTPPRRKRADLEVQTANFVESVEGNMGGPAVKATEDIEVENQVLAIEPETTWTESPRQTRISEEEIEVIEDIAEAAVQSAVGSQGFSVSQLEGVETKLAQLLMESSLVAQTHESGLALPPREDHLYSQELLRVMGVPVLIANAPYEAEGLAAHMCKAKLVDYVGTEDSDVLAYGAPMLRYMTDSSKPIETLSGEDVRAALNLSDDQFLDFMILLGTDASDRIHDVGPIKALKYIKQHGSIENIIQEEVKIAAKIPADFSIRMNIARGVFRDMPPLPSKDELEVDVAPEKVVQAFMKEKHGVVVPDAGPEAVGRPFDPEADHGRDDHSAASAWSTTPAPRKLIEPKVIRRLPPVKKDGLTLQHFVMRTEILKAYRGAVRTTRALPDSSTRRETLDWMRSDLERLRTVIDLGTIKEHLGSFLRTQKQFGPSLGLSIAGIDDALGTSRSASAKLVGQKRQADLLTRRFMD